MCATRELTVGQSEAVPKSPARSTAELHAVPQCKLQQSGINEKRDTEVDGNHEKTVEKMYHVALDQTVQIQRNTISLN